MQDTGKTFLDSNELVLNMGPQHPSTHGVLRVILKLDGEKVLGSDCVIGYLHRGVEKIAENRTYVQFNPYVDRMDYVAAVSNGLGYCEAVEKLLGVEAPERANVYPRDPDRTQPFGKPPGVAGHARAQHRRADPSVLLLPRPRRDSEDLREVLRRPSHHACLPNRRMPVRDLRGLREGSFGLLRLRAAEDRRI